MVGPTLTAPIRIGLVGFGYWGPNLARNLAEMDGIILGRISDPSRERRQLAAIRYPGVTASENAFDTITAGDIDAVVLATPVATHFALTLAALKAGKDVLVEKPLAATRAEAEALGELAEREGRVLMVDHTYAYAGPVVKMAELVGVGELGEVCYYDSTRINLGLFQNDVSVIWDLAVHDLSILQHVLRRRFETIQTTGTATWGSPFESVAHITLGLAGDIQAHLNVSWIAPVKIRQTIIVGDRKMLLYNDLENDEKIKIYDRGVVFEPDRRLALLREYRIGDMHAPKVDRHEPLARVCEHFLSCVRERTPPRTGAREAIEVIQALEAAEWSLRHDGKKAKLA